MSNFIDILSTDAASTGTDSAGLGDQRAGSRLSSQGIGESGNRKFRRFGRTRLQEMPPYIKVRASLTRIHMSTATVTSKGQITIPVDVRKALQVDSGDRVEFVQLEPGQFLVVAANRSVTELKGMFGKAAKSISIESMNGAIAARGAAAR
jgi:antitoxin PrlF